MRKSLLALSAALVAVSGMAATPQQVWNPAQRSIVNRSEVKALDNLQLSTSASSMLKAPAAKASSRDVITSVDGERKNMTATGSGYYLFWGIMLAAYEDATSATHFIYGGENNSVYIYDILPEFANGSYVKGYIEDNKIIVDLPQMVYWVDEANEGAGDGYQLGMYDYIEYEEDGEMVATYVPSETKTSLTITIAEDGSMVADVSDDCMLGAGVYSADGGWAGYGAISLSFEPFDGVLVTPPSDIEVSKNFWNIISDGYGWPVSWAQGYDEVYFQGISPNVPEAWIRGTVEYDDSFATISIAQDQYIGNYAGYYLYTKCAKAEYDETGEMISLDLMPADYQYQLIWDYEDNVMTAKDPEVFFVVNAAEDRVYYLDMFSDLKLIHQDSYEGTPANPYDLEFRDTMEAYGYNGFFFEVPAISTEGELLNTADLYYVVYVDGEEWELEADLYGMDENLVEVPWDYVSPNLYIYSYGGVSREVDFFVEGISTVGVQSVYKYDGVETRSEIVTLDLESGSKVNALDADKKVAKVAYYDIAGRAVANPANGLFIKKTTYTDGSVVSTKSFIR